MASHTTVGVDDDLAARETGIAHGPTDHEAPGWIDVEDRVVVDHLGGQAGVDHLLDDVLANLFVGCVRIVLGRDHNCVDAHGIVVVVVLHGHLRLRVGPQVADLSTLERAAKGLDQSVGITDGRGHQLWSLVAREPEHHALVPGALLLVQPFAFAHTLGDIRGLFAQRDLNRTGGRVKAHLGAGVSDVVHHAANQRGKVDCRIGRDFAQQQHHARSRGRFTGDTGVRVLGQEGVQHRVRNLIAHLVRVTH